MMNDISIVNNLWYCICNKSLVEFIDSANSFLANFRCVHNLIHTSIFSPAAFQYTCFVLADKTMYITMRLFSDIFPELIITKYML